MLEFRQYWSANVSVQTGTDESSLNLLHIVIVFKILSTKVYIISTLGLGYGNPTHVDNILYVCIIYVRKKFITC